MSNIFFLDSNHPDLITKARQAARDCQRPLFVALYDEGTGPRAFVDAGLLTPAQVLPEWQMSGIHRFEGTSVTIYWVNVPREQHARQLSFKADWIGVETPGDFARVRFAATARTRHFALNRTTRAPGYLIENEQGWQWRRAPEELPVDNDHSPVLIIGAGLAGSMCAYELAQRGISSVAVDAGCVPGAGASALYAGLIHPHWQAVDSPVFKLTRVGYLRMLKLLEAVPEAFVRMGVFDCAADDEEYERWQTAFSRHVPLAMPADFARLIDRQRARALVGMPVKRGGWWFERAGLVHAGKLCRALFARAKTRMVMNTAVHLSREEDFWVARDRYGTEVARAKRVIVAAALNSADVLDIPRSWLGMSGLFGRISLLQDNDLPVSRAAMTGDGYIAKTGDGFCGVGATYEPGEKAGLSECEAVNHNLSTFDKLFSEPVPVLPLGFYQGVRAVSRDRMPLVGRGFTRRTFDGLVYQGRPEAKRLPRAENLWLCAGMGSRGLTWGAACAQSVVADMLGEPPIVEAALLAGLDPARFMPDVLVNSAG